MRTTTRPEELSNRVQRTHFPACGNVVSMSSREIADLTGKEHKNVKRDIELMLKELKLDPLSFERIYLDGLNRKQTEYHLDRELTETLVTGYSIPLRHKVVRRLHEMEKDHSQVSTIPDFDDPVAAARAWADAKESEQQVTKQLAIAAPKIEFFDQYADSTNLNGFRQVCKLLNVKEDEFRKFLQAKKLMYRLNGDWMPFSGQIKARRFAVKTGTAANGRTFIAAKFTPQGVQWVSRLWAEYQLEVTA